MSISYVGHSRLSVAATKAKIDFILGAHPEWFESILHMGPPRPFTLPFEPDISRDFGIEAKCRFTLDIYDKERFPECLNDAIDFTYRVFGTDDLVITFELDSIRKPAAQYPPMRLP